jgi:hypothetical protein
MRWKEQNLNFKNESETGDFLAPFWNFLVPEIMWKLFYSLRPLKLTYFDDFVGLK